MARDRALAFGALVDARLADPQERARPSVLRQLGPAYRTVRLFELVADLNDATVLYDLPEGDPRRVGRLLLLDAALALALLDGIEEGIALERAIQALQRRRTG